MQLASPVHSPADRPALVHLDGGRALGTALTAADRARAASAPPVVLVSGMMAEPSVWRNWVASLERDGFRVFAVNTASWGFGPVEGDVAAVTQAIEAVQLLSGARRVHLVGHSKGGITALEVARRRPGAVARIVTISTPHHGVGPAALGWLARHARLGPVRAPVLLREMSTGSPWVSRPLPDGVPVTSIFAPHFDGLVTSASARLGGGRDVELHGGPLQLFHAVTNVTNVEAYEQARSRLLGD